MEAEGEANADDMSEVQADEPSLCFRAIADSTEIAVLQIEAYLRGEIQFPYRTCLECIQKIEQKSKSIRSASPENFVDGTLNPYELFRTIWHEARAGLTGDLPGHRAQGILQRARYVERSLQQQVSVVRVQATTGQEDDVPWTEMTTSGTTSKGTAPQRSEVEEWDALSSCHSEDPKSITEKAAAQNTCPLCQEHLELVQPFGRCQICQMEHLQLHRCGECSVGACCSCCLKLEAVQRQSAAGRSGRKPLHYATQNGWREVVRFLLEIRADLEARDSDQKTALHMALDKNMVRCLLDNNADPLAQDAEGKMPHQSAAERGHKDVVEFLLDSCQLDVHAVTSQGQTLLHLAVKGDLRALAYDLITRGVDVKAKDDEDMTCLHLAAQHASVDVIELLLKHRADINARSVWNESALHLAAAANSSAVTCLLANGSNVAATNLGGLMPLHLAARAGAPHVVLELLDHGAEVNAGEVTALHCAAEMGAKEVVQVLIERRAHLHAREDPLRRTALHVAASVDVVECLLAAGADVDALDAHNKTAKDLAEESEKSEVVQLLNAGR